MGFSSPQGDRCEMIISLGCYGVFCRQIIIIFFKYKYLKNLIFKYFFNICSLYVFVFLQSGNFGA